MPSPARPATPVAPDTTPEPRRGGRISPDARSARRPVLLSALVAALAAVLFPLAPVHQPEVTYTWPTAPGDPTAAAVPLMPYQPVRLTASVGCAAARDAGDRTLLATVPPRPDPAALPLSGLRVTAEGGALRFESAGVDLGTVPLPPATEAAAGDCTVEVVSTYARTTVLLDGREVLARSGDVRPDVAGVFTEARDARGLAVELTADTRFQTTITPLKAAIGAVAVLALVGMLLALRRADREERQRNEHQHREERLRLLPRRWWRPRPVDAAVTALLGTWWVVGAITVDDGYIAGIVRSRGSNGFIGNVYRWLNAPEAPFSWFYDVYYAWSLVSTSTLWMRLPSTLLGLLCWALLSRLALPWLGRVAARRSTPWIAALAFGTWWIPFNLGLRPEPWVAVGMLAVVLAVERAIATRRLLPLAAALVVAGATTAVTPAGLMAFAPFLAAAVPVLRLLRARADLHALPLLAVLVAAPASALLLMASDQSLAGIVEATRVRGLIGGGLPWFQEYERYAALLEPDTFQGAIGRRAAVLLTLLAAVAVLWGLYRHLTDAVAAGPARRLVVTFLLAAASLTLSPTKWTQHFGDLAGIGAAVLLLGLVSAGPVLRRTGARSGVVGLAVAGVTCALVLAGRNLWPYASDWFAPTWSTVPPLVGATPLATIALAITVAVVAVVAARVAWRRAGGAAATGLPRRVPDPARPVGVVLVAVLALQVLSLVRVSVENPGGYTLASDAVATVRGEPCGLQRDVLVETDPAAGVLRPGPAAAGTVREVRVDVGGTTVPGVAVSGSGSTAWAPLHPDQRGGTLPVVVTVAGAIRPGDEVAVEFGRAGTVVDRVALNHDGDAPTDRRLIAPAEADAVRLAVDAPPAGAAGTPAAVSLPRAPRLTPMPD
ncbi:MAG TPA: arabinosyltransferase domain-containing protein, partial [Pseudonocardia sp.]|nr:arabinosyltransferase domain-containing protein [Pseudonocardia sp.]